MSIYDGASKIFTDEQLLNSPTFQRISILSRVNPINASNPVEVDAALASSLLFLVDALDNNAIQFKSKADENALLQMMLVCHQVVAQMRPISATKH